MQPYLYYKQTNKRPRSSGARRETSFDCSRSIIIYFLIVSCLRERWRASREEGKESHWGPADKPTRKAQWGPIPIRKELNLLPSFCPFIVYSLLHLADNLLLSSYFLHLLIILFIDLHAIKTIFLCPSKHLGKPGLSWHTRRRQARSSGTGMQQPQQQQHNNNKQRRPAHLISHRYQLTWQTHVTPLVCAMDTRWIDGDIFRLIAQI